MSTIRITPVKTKSAGGYDVEIRGIDPTSGDCLVGQINTPGRGLINGCWDLHGLMRDASSECNLDMRDAVNAELAETARRLGVGG